MPLRKPTNIKNKIDLNQIKSNSSTYLDGPGQPGLGERKHVWTDLMRVEVADGLAEHDRLERRHLVAEELVARHHHVAHACDGFGFEFGFELGRRIDG